MLTMPVPLLIKEGACKGEHSVLQPESRVWGLGFWAEPEAEQAALRVKPKWPAAMP